MTFAVTFLTKRGTKNSPKSPPREGGLSLRAKLERVRFYDLRVAEIANGKRIAREISPAAA